MQNNLFQDEIRILNFESCWRAEICQTLISEFSILVNFWTTQSIPLNQLGFPLNHHSSIHQKISPQYLILNARYMKWHILCDNEANLQLTAACANVQQYTNEKTTLLIYLKYQYKKIQSKPNNVRYFFYFNIKKWIEHRIFFYWKGMLEWFDRALRLWIPYPCFLCEHY